MASGHQPGSVIEALRDGGVLVVIVLFLFLFRFFFLFLCQGAKRAAVKRCHGAGERTRPDE
jgi:hypothetical protein